MSKSKPPKAISLAFDSHNTRLTVLCDDGSIWERFAERTQRRQGGQDIEKHVWAWREVCKFQPVYPSEYDDKVYRETGI